MFKLCQSPESFFVLLIGALVVGFVAWFISYPIRFFLYQAIFKKSQNASNVRFKIEEGHYYIKWEFPAWFAKCHNRRMRKVRLEHIGMGTLGDYETRILFCQVCGKMETKFLPYLFLEFPDFGTLEVNWNPILKASSSASK